MPEVSVEHFKRAAAEIGRFGDNDTLPFDLDNRFVKAKSNDLGQMAFDLWNHLSQLSKPDTIGFLKKLSIYSERLLVPSGPAGFRITTKIHPFWNIYFNGLAIAIAEQLESQRSPNAHSYRFLSEGEELFDKERSWRAYKEATLNDPALEVSGAIVIQTDISSFYERIYHHRLAECIDELFEGTNFSAQISELLAQFASSSRRSFGLPVGGQGSRILAELLMASIDQRLTESGLKWHRYVDDFTLIASSNEEAYKALSILSHALADYGLSLNRSKTTLLTAKHYKDYVTVQLGAVDDEAASLREIDLQFDPYSDSPEGDYEALKEAVGQLDVSALLKTELGKVQPDSFLVKQISRTLQFQTPEIARDLCSTMLAPRNLHAFRASWLTIMRGVAALRANDQCEAVFDKLDLLLDAIPAACPHLLLPEGNCLHFLRTLRFKKTEDRSRYVTRTYEDTKSQTVKRACVQIWAAWQDNANFTRLRNDFSTQNPQTQRMIWIASFGFTQGGHFRGQERGGISSANLLGFEDHTNKKLEDLYKDWIEHDLQSLSA